MLQKAVLNILISLTVTACSGGDISIVKTGVFNNISGLCYSIAPQSGIVATDGKFNYEENETITFSVGDAVIGTTEEAKASMDTADLIRCSAIYQNCAGGACASFTH